MKMGIYTKTDDGFKIEPISGKCEYALGTTESHKVTLRMGVDDRGLILFMDIDDMQDFTAQLRKCVDQLKAEVIEDYFKNVLGKEFEF